MKTRVAADKFFVEVLSYVEATKILDGKLLDNFLLSTPILFLYRHEVELLLKAHILLFLSRQNENIENLDFVLQKSNNKEWCFSSTHSPKILLEYYISKKIDLLIRPDYDLIKMKKVSKIINDIDKKDFNSTYFRYPINKSMRNNNRMRILREELSVSNNIKDGTYVANIDGIIHTVRHTNLLKLREKLVFVVQFFLDLYPHVHNKTLNGLYFK